MSTPVTGGDTNVVRYFQLRLAADGTAATGLTITGIDLQYTRTLAAAATKTDAIVGTGEAATHVDNKVFEIDATSSPGLYMVCFADAAFAAGVPEVILTVKEATIFSTSMAVAIDPPVNLTSIEADQQSTTDLKDFADAGYDPATNKVTGVLLTDTLTTYTGNTLQTGDVITAINDLANATDGLTALKAAIDLQATLAICTETRIAELDAGNLPTDIAAIPTTMVGTDNAALASVCTETRLAALTDWLNGGRLDLIIDAILADTNELQSDNVPGLIAALNNISAANVNTEVLDVMNVDTITLPAQGAPPLAPTHRQMAAWLYKVFRNRTTQTATQFNLYADDESTIDTKATVSDDATTAIKQELVSGP